MGWVGVALGANRGPRRLSDAGASEKRQLESGCRRCTDSRASARSDLPHPAEPRRDLAAWCEQTRGPPSVPRPPRCICGRPPRPEQGRTLDGSGTRLRPGRGVEPPQRRRSLGLRTEVERALGRSHTRGHCAGTRRPSPPRRRADPPVLDPPTQPHDHSKCDPGHETSANVGGSPTNDFSEGMASGSP